MGVTAAATPADHGVDVALNLLSKQTPAISCLKY